MNFLKMKALKYWEMLKNHWDFIETKKGLMWIVIIIVALIIFGFYQKFLLVLLLFSLLDLLHIR